ncbi:alpha/beta hydrolase [Chloroflexota bacterium]
MTQQGQTGIYFESGGFRLLGTLFLASGDEPKPTVIILHGVPGIEKNYDLAHNLRSYGWNSLIFHYRGCWGSEGCYTFKTIPKDVNAAIDTLFAGSYSQIDTSRLFLIGHSLGGWAAINVASNDLRVQGVIAIASIADPRAFSFSEEDAAMNYTPWLNGLSPLDFITQWKELGQFSLPVNNVSQINPRPVFLIPGQNDELVPVSQSVILFENALEPRTLVIQDEANHSFVWHRQWLISQIIDWLDRLKIYET